MRTIPPGFAARIEGQATTLARCFVVTRADGAVFGFTDHDRPLAVGGVTCEPGTGLDRSAATSHAGLAVGEEEIAGALSSDAISDADIAAGLWDDAEVVVHLVDFEAPQHRIVLRTGRIGEVTRADGAFRAELRGPAAALDTVTGRRYLATCDAALGDTRCKVALGPFTVSATVAEAEDARHIRVAGIGGTPAGRYAGGRLTIADGPLKGAGGLIEAHLVDGAAVTLVLRVALPGLPAEGAALTLVAGCDKTFPTCRDVFQNAINFRGFPHVPGRDAAFAYAREGGTNDGGTDGS